MNTHIILMKVDYVVFRLLKLTKVFSRTCLVFVNIITSDTGKSKLQLFYTM